MPVKSYKMSAVASVLLLTACSSVSVERLASDPAPVVGRYPYALSRTSLTVTATVTLTSCGAIQDDPKVNVFRPTLGLTETIAATPTFEPDPEQIYDVPYDQLRRVFGKETNISVTRNANGTLSGINATVNDQVGPGAVAAVEAAVKIAAGVAVPALGATEAVTTAVKVASGSGPMNAGHGHRLYKVRKVTKIIHHAPPPKFCTDSVMAALASIDAKSQDAAAKAAADAKSKATVASPGIAKDQADIVRLQTENHLTRTVRLIWTPTGGEADEARDPGAFVITRDIDLYAAAIKPWLSNVGQAWFASASASPAPPATPDGGAARTAALLVTTPVVVQLDLIPFTMGKNLPVGGGKPDELHPTLADPLGIVIRDPAEGMLRLCRGDCTASDQTLHDTDGEVGAPASVAMGQFGRMLVFHLKNRLFENSTFAISLGADGSIASVGNHTTGTLATGLGTLGDAGTAAVTANAAYDTALAARNTNTLNKAALTGSLNQDLANCYAGQDAARKAGAVPIGTCG